MTKINYFQNKKELEKKLENLPKKSTTLKMVDFDDTLFSRYEQLNGTDEISLLLQKNRGAKGNEVMKNVIGIKTLMEKYYVWKEFPKTIVSQMDKNQDVILTAGIEELQKAKIQATKLERFPLKIVLHSYEKPQALAEYIISLWFIPEAVEIYEDRTEHFQKAKKEFEDLVWTNLQIFFVEMENNKTEPKITKL